MASETCQADQRESVRYRVRGSAYALLKQPQYKELGKIVDVSQTGISFLCINRDDWGDEPFAIDIFVGYEAGNGRSEQIILKDIPLHPIAYCNDDDQMNVTFAKMQRCGVRFGKLTSDQRAKLDLFILRHGFANA